MPTTDSSRSRSWISAPGTDLGGPPAEQELYGRLRSIDEARRMWRLSAELTGVGIPE